MSKDLKSYYLSESPTADKYYDSIKKYVVKKDSIMYGAVLVKMKQIKAGFSIKFRFNWHWWRHYLKPELPSRFRKTFSWLIFFINWEYEYELVPDKVIKDHLKESITGECHNNESDMQ
jgi:hypothetical protein